MTLIHSYMKSLHRLAVMIGMVILSMAPMSAQNFEFN